MRKIRNQVLALATVLIASQPLIALISKVSATELVNQSIEICFVGLDFQGNVISSLPGVTSVSMDLYSDGGPLVEGQVNSYGVVNTHIYGTNASGPNKKISTDNGLIDANCTSYSFKKPANHEYTYSPVTIESDRQWQVLRYNDDETINFSDPDVAFPYSAEWFDDLAGNESLRNVNSDGQIVMSAERPNRRLVVVAQLAQNLPDYEVVFSDAVPAPSEYTLTTIPTNLTPGYIMNLRFGVQNMGGLTWQSAQAGVPNPVNVSYHWKNKLTGEYYQFDGNRAVLNHDVPYTLNDSNIALAVNVPTVPGEYELILDLVHEGVTWFSQAGANTKKFTIQVGQNTVSKPAAPIPQVLSNFTSSASLSAGSYYTVKPYQGGSWHCGGWDCYSGIAEEFYQCSSRGISNYSFGTDENALKGMCWWPIYNANRHLPVPVNYSSKPWEFVEVGWQLFIPANPWSEGTTPPVTPSINFTPGVPESSISNLYAGMYGSNSAWPELTFDRFIAWDGSQKFDQIKWSETRRPSTPTITGLATDAASNTVSIYGIAIPKGHPINVRVWNEYRYCWACGSGWELHYQQGTAQHVKVVLFKNNWEYIGQVWNDAPNGRWSVTLPLGTNLNPGDRVFAEVQVEADYTFSGLRWWSDTYETVNFNVRNPKYFGYPYFGSGGGNVVNVPRIVVDNRSAEQIAIDSRADLIGATGGGDFTTICGSTGKYYSNLRNGQAGMIVFINNRAVYSWGGTYDTFNWYGDRCERFGVPVDDPHDGGVGPFNTSGAYQDFQKGRIYWSWKYVGKFVYGTIWNKFEQAGGTNSHYGWPTSETYLVIEVEKKMICQNFEGGVICTDPPNNKKRIAEAIEEVQKVLNKTYPFATDYWRYLWLREDRDRIASILTNYEGTISYVSSSDLNDMQLWLQDAQYKYLGRLKSDSEKRWLLNAIYIRNLRTLKNLRSITDLEAFARGADFISKYWDDTQDGRDNFEKDLAVVFSNRDGKDCIFSSEGCFGNLTDKQRAFYVGGFGGTGFNTIFDDNKYGTNNTLFHITGLGINFSYSGDNLCGPSSRDVAYLPVYLCMNVEEWAIFHETWQQKRMSISNIGEGGSSWEDLFSSLVGISLGRELRNAELRVAEFGNQIRYRFGIKEYKVCFDLVPLIPEGKYWDKVTCDSIPDRLK